MLFRVLLVLLTLSALSGCEPCISLSEKAQECGDSTFADPNVCFQTRARAPSLGLTFDEYDCIASCTGSGTCAEFQDRAYSSCYCEDRCGVDCDYQP